MTQATGTFDVKMTPVPSADPTTIPGQMTLSKTFAGDLAGSGKGVMLTAVTATEGSAGYVAIEQVTGELNGRKGSFVLQHSGTMSGGQQSLTITIVPDSGTDALSGLSGTMSIAIDEAGQHTYTLTYTLPEA